MKKTIKKEEGGIYFEDIIRDESGVTVVEAVFIVSTVVIVVCFLVIVGFIYYQESLLQTVADYTASSIARTHSYENKDPVTGYISKDALSDQGLIGSLYHLKTILKDRESSVNSLSGIKEDVKDQEVKEALAMIYELNNSKRLRAAKKYEYTVEIKTSELVCFQDEIVVTISESYYIPFTKFLGIDKSIITKTYKGKAICYDLLGANSYWNTIDVIAYNFGQDKNNHIAKIIGNIFDSLMHTGTGISNILKAVLNWNSLK